MEVTLGGIVLCLNNSISENLGISPAQAHLLIEERSLVGKQLGITHDERGGYAEWKERLILADIRRRKVAWKRIQKWKAKHSDSRSIEVGDTIFIGNHALSDACENHIKKMLDLFAGQYICVGKMNE